VSITWLDHLVHNGTGIGVGVDQLDVVVWLDDLDEENGDHVDFVFTAPEAMALSVYLARAARAVTLVGPIPDLSPIPGEPGTPASDQGFSQGHVDIAPDQGRPRGHQLPVHVHAVGGGIR
jgi:hypothetical protein